MGPQYAAPYLILKSAGLPGSQILADHQCHAEHDSMVELTQIQTGELADLFQTVDQSVAVYEQFPGSLGTFRLFSKNLLMVNRVS